MKKQRTDVSCGPLRRTHWAEEGICSRLCLIAADDEKGNASRKGLPASLYTEAIAPFLHFDSPVPNQLYVVGGRDQQQEPLDTVEMFDTWHGRWVDCPRMSVRRAGCAVTALPNGQLFVIGGYDERGIVEGLLDSCEVFEPATQRWSNRCAALGRARWGHGCAMLGKRVYVVGGCALRAGTAMGDEIMETLKACEAYDPDRDTWTPLASLQVGRAGARCVVLGGGSKPAGSGGDTSLRRLVVVGGCDDVFGQAETLSSVEVYDPEANCWALLSRQLAVPRTTAAVATIGSDTILVVGGAPSLASAETLVVPPPPASGADSAVVDEAGELPDSTTTSSREAVVVSALMEGRMGCQAVAMDLPAPGGHYPVCISPCVVVVGGENGDEEDWEANPVTRQFSSVLVFDVARGEWRPEKDFPPMTTPRTAMAVCTGPGRVSGYH